MIARSIVLSTALKAAFAAGRVFGTQPDVLQPGSEDRLQREDAPQAQELLAAAEVKPQLALESVVRLFDTYQVVGLSDLHGCTELLAFVERLVQSADFTRQVNDITFEPGNVRFQPLMDDFILHGKDIPLGELRRAWRENTQAHTYSDTPALLHLLQTIRTVNLALPESRRLRVLCIDPPVDWSTIQSRDDLRGQDFDRETHMATVLEREVYAKGRKALFFAGGAHVSRGGQPHVVALPLGNGPGPQRVPFGRQPDGPREPVRDVFPGSPAAADRRPVPELVGPLQSLERRHPGTTYAIGIHEGFGEPTVELEKRLADWQRPALVAIRNTWWGGLPLPPSGDIMIGPDGKRVLPPGDRKVQDNWDAILYLGKRSELTRVDPPGPDVLDAQWLQELERRHAIMSGPPRGEAPLPLERKFFAD